MAGKTTRSIWFGLCLVGAIAGSMAALPSSAADAADQADDGMSKSAPRGSPAAPSDSGNLSERLDKSGGVIAPPEGVDSKILVNPPNASPGKMPVIPPPGTPGGNKDVVPK